MHEGGVDCHGCGSRGTGGGDDRRARINDVAGCRDAWCGRVAVAVSNDESFIVDVDSLFREEAASDA
jgi:hypothetical protein